MTRITAGLFISLDGVVEAPDQWHFPYFNDEMGAAVDAQLGSAETILLGRATYDSFVGAWPQREADGGEDAEFAKKLGDTRKIVVSRQRLSFGPGASEATGEKPGASEATGEKPGASEATGDKPGASYDWRNSEQLHGDLLTGVRELKAQPGGDIGIAGSVSVVRELLAAGLLDELHLLVHPVVVGTGARLFRDADALPLKLLSSTAFRTGVVHSVYTKDDGAPNGSYEDAKQHL
ncbi:dihydrofolate reductase family protein [Mycolicibacterium neoaurum]|uniref:dihydrofolate reductase family protein n=1 Tax=Mycolicibacterium neoaurum TaxID=1795 RepID=UPI00248CAC3F|nr:dihydrofolate reductase family protein [Mycolicibacterium neoaurum]WBP92868.1 dihydrofolate reductase family protein [Mycolicibacterium neoaurum]WBS07836.1 dihydrofolate reductase family protein [Mycolicibacterium neoaurum]